MAKEQDTILVSLCQQDAEIHSKFVLHFGKCLCRDGSLIPNGDQLEQSKEILSKVRFKEEPGWFVFIQ